LPEPALKQFREIAFRRYPSAFVSYLSGAHLFSNEGMVLSRDNYVLSEYYHEFNTRELRRAIYSRPFWLMTSNVRRIKESIGLLAAPQGWNYYHWILDVVPRVHLLERWRKVIEQYAVPAELSAVQIESLRLVGISETQLLRLKPAQRLRCQHLYAPSLPGSEGCSPPWVLQFLQERFLPLAAATRGAGSLIYIVRGPSAQRQIMNELALVACLERRGFKAVSLEEQSVLQQAAIFRDARMIVAAHGAGLANLVFSRKTAVLELFSADYLRPDCYFTISCQAGHHYDCWVDASTVSPSKPWGAINADIGAIERKIDSLQDAIDKTT
jgi:capsular polysaccharide biosynthesis protein